MSRAKPDIFMPFYGNEFWPSVDGHPDFVILAYLRIIWHYWHHLSCAGFPNDEAYQRRIGRLFDDTQWHHARGVIFGQYFKIDASGLWQQKRATEVWADTKKTMEARRNQTFAARKARHNKPNQHAL
jgi:hypothetical protein